MKRLSMLSELSIKSDSKILFWVFDGVGGLPHPTSGLTELETAEIPHLDAFAGRASCGGLQPSFAGVTPGSGPGHMAIFGYPVEAFDLPRGVLEVLGAEETLLEGEVIEGFALEKGDLAMRGNFASMEGPANARVISDRRANSITTDESRQMCILLSDRLRMDGYRLYFFPGQGHRFAVVIRGPGLCGGLTDGDPQKSGLPLKMVEATDPAAHKSAMVVNELIGKATEVLEGQEKAHTVLLRGIGTPPDIPSLPELYKLRCAAVATYPMYKGIAQLVGMDVLDVGSMSHRDQVETLRRHYDDYDFFYLHIKETDSYAHLGDFEAKAGVLTSCDAIFAEALALGFDVVVVTGDHCTPSVLGDHSWHPIPTMIWSRQCLADDVQSYSERACYRGSLGIRPARDLMALTLAEAGKLNKFGA